MIRRTIEEHLDKELRLRPQGIKVLSLFFIDVVERHLHLTVAREHREVARVHFFSVASKGAHAEIAGALREQQMHRPLALHLQRQMAFEFQRSR